jgi:hypothetical protein
MNEDKKTDSISEEEQTVEFKQRREFLKRSAKTAIWVVPATTTLLAATQIPEANAQTYGAGESFSIDGSGFTVIEGSVTVTRPPKEKGIIEGTLDNIGKIVGPEKPRLQGPTDVAGIRD